MLDKLIVEHSKTAYIKGLYQWPTYGGLLEGLPTDRMNSEILKNIRQQAKRHCGDKEVFVIEPEQTPIEYEGKYPFGTPMALPNIICVANLECLQGARDPNRDGSMLTIVWFQNSYAFPIDNNTTEKLKNLPWSKLAEDFDY